MFKKTLAALTVAGAAVTGVGAMANAGLEAQVAPAADAEFGAASVEEDGAMRCNGGRHIRHASILDDVPLQFIEDDGEVSLGKLRFNVPGRTDLVQVEYNAETRLYGAEDDGHWIELRFYLDGQLMNPNDDTSPLALANDSEGWESNSTRACARVGEGKHVVEAKAVLSDFYDSADLVGWLDDSTFSIDIYG
jgi:hypothetical protein